MKIEIVKHSHNAGESNIHFQLTPAFRRDVFVDEKVRKLTEAYLFAKAENLRVVIVSVNFGPDHMHFFVADCKNYSAAFLAQQFKGFISRMMRKNHWNFFRHKLYGEKFWTSGYFYRTIGAVNAETVKYYIEHSQAKHWEVVDYEFYLYQKQKTLMEF